MRLDLQFGSKFRSTIWFYNLDRFKVIFENKFVTISNDYVKSKKFNCFNRSYYKWVFNQKRLTQWFTSYSESNEIIAIVYF